MTIEFRKTVYQVLACLALLSGIQLNAATVSLKPVADTGLFEKDPNFNSGSQTDFPVGTLGTRAMKKRSRGLFKFDVAGNLPANAKITGATLAVTVQQVPGEAVASNFSLHRVLKDWGEGTKTGFPGGSQAGAGEATWNARFHPDQLWGSPGGEEGTDYVGTASSTERLSGLATYTFEFGAIGLADLQLWLDDPNSNFGWLLKTEAEATAFTARRIAARENASAAPVLTIEFEEGAAPTAPLITRVGLQDGTVHIQFMAQAGVRYQLQARGDLVSGDWQAITEVGPASEDGLLSVSGGPVSASAQFYRLQVIQ